MDKWLGAFFVGLSLFLLVLSQRMPVIAHLGPLAAPGLFPTIVSVIILSLGLILAGKDLPRNLGGYKLTRPDWLRLKGNAIKIISDNENLKALLALAVISLYVFFLGRIDYFLATIIFLILFMFAFKAANWYKIIIISVLFTIIVTQVFTRIFLIPLP